MFHPWDGGEFYVKTINLESVLEMTDVLDDIKVSKWQIILLVKSTG